jgi:hypothetical protein
VGAPFGRVIGSVRWGASVVNKKTTIGGATGEAVGGAVLESATALVGAAVGDAMPK